MNKAYKKIDYYLTADRKAFATSEAAQEHVEATAAAELNLLLKDVLAQSGFQVGHKLICLLLTKSEQVCKILSPLHAFDDTTDNNE